MIQDNVGNAADAATSASVAKVTPTIVGGVIFFGVQLSDWVLIVTGIYTTLLIGGFIYGVIKDRNKRKK